MVSWKKERDRSIYFPTFFPICPRLDVEKHLFSRSSLIIFCVRENKCPKFGT